MELLARLTLLRKRSGIVGAVVLSLGALGHAVRKQPDRTPLDTSIDSATELVAIFIGSSGCGAAQRRGFDDTVTRLKSKLKRDAERAGMRFVSIGVALDWDHEAGLAFLDHFAPFDEISVGRNWLNSNALRYIWRDMPGEPAIPQLLLTTRDVVNTSYINVSDEVLLTRVRGIEEIETLANDATSVLRQSRGRSGM